ncbi:carboxylesterase family protein [Sorangium sp. So ce216]
MTTTTAPIINTVEGPVQGTIVEDVVAYMGIPYAEPPLVNLRWKPPQPVKPWTEPLPSNDKAPSCLQDRNMCIAVGGGDPHPMSEDCLYLNVWTPQHKAGVPELPVMVWIHGGAYIIGAGRLLTYHGANIVKRGAILVTINYRMGALGFFAHPALDNESRDGKIFHNFGLLDQIAALEWVQRNIGKFGGDPNNVTIFGQSAGARSVLALFASPLVKDRNPPLFHRGIAQSVYRSPEATKDQAFKRSAKLAEILLSLPAGQGHTATAEQLRLLGAERLMNIDKDFDPKGTGNSPVAISGDSVLPSPVIASFVAGTVSALPLIIGNTSDDGSVVIDQLPGGDPQQIVTLAQFKAGITYPKRYYSDLWDEAQVDQKELGRRLARDAFFTVTTHKIAEAHGPRASTWRYYFNYTAENLRPHVPNGTRHGDDVPFTMNTLDAAPPFPPIPLVPPIPPGTVPVPEPVAITATDRAVANSVSAYWFNFAKTGTPAPATEWPLHTATADKTLLLGESVSVATDFMQQHHEDAKYENMVAFERIGVAMDETAAGQG